MAPISANPPTTGHDGHKDYPDVSSVKCPNLVIFLMFLVCMVCMAMAIYQGDWGSWRQLERVKERRAEARRQRMAQGEGGLGITVPSNAKVVVATERTPLLLVVPPPATSSVYAVGFPSPALSGYSGTTEIPPLQEVSPDLEEARKRGRREFIRSLQRSFTL
ncbi:hypothetical protein QBC38DRAFT_452312 [Podospora fimiseda]|uniref:Transmembrane protein n=1 Tax=Podospora fimiseda TaxID=252190 RepID=A0AAN7BVL6_9PEZI|nr:hypothetical protein QBC38DRAFT_452312 [Podospora fimiseda]